MIKALAKRFEGQQIVMLVDEIQRTDMLNKLEEKGLPESVRMILVVNPDAEGSPLTLPSSMSP